MEVPSESRPTEAEAEATTPAPAPEPAEAEAVPVEPVPDEEPALPPRRMAPEPEGPVLETAELPDVPDVASGVKPLTLPRIIAIAIKRVAWARPPQRSTSARPSPRSASGSWSSTLIPRATSTGLGLNPRDVEGSVYDVLLNDTPLEDIIEPTSLANLFVRRPPSTLRGLRSSWSRS